MNTYDVSYKLGVFNMQEPVEASDPEEAARKVQKLRYNRHLGFITQFLVGETLITLDDPNDLFTTSSI